MNTRPLFSAHRHAQTFATWTGAALALAAWASPAHAQYDTARVLSSTPVYQQVAHPREVCRDEVVTVPGQKSGAGAVMGGVAGGALGNAVGDGSGRAVATVIGIVGGAMLGNRIEGNGAPESQVVRQCGTQTVYDNRLTGYNVVYEYAGRQYTVQMPQDPGATLQVQITPVVPSASVSSSVQWYPSAPPPVQRPRHWR